MTIFQLFYKESSKDPAVHEAHINLQEVSMIVRIGQQTVGVVVPGGWHEFSLTHDNLMGIEKINKCADTYIDLMSAWREIHEPGAVKKTVRRAKTPEAPIAPIVPAAVAEHLAAVKAAPTIVEQRRALTALGDQIVKNGLAAAPAPAPRPPVSMSRPPVQDMPPHTVGVTHPFKDSSGLPTMIDLRDIMTISGFSDGSNKVRLGLHRGSVRTVFLILKDGETFDAAYSKLYNKWVELTQF
jgi:hypothetical protein